ncbi:FAD-dependent oxidoreductase [Clostridium sp. BJN0001]|uniref:NAD(P)/FAD-dependent oxidoreductase n=1 Tax=Clostridium sp. BJN0001 TaxID=2930219 RepID=UPI001FD4125A|nr:FAD-dependent oxidoreductase [Clostridium sp. BJN0001]
MQNYELIILGAGVAGMAAAVEAAENGIKDILILEQDCYGGIMNEFIDNSYGEKVFGYEVTGPEYVDYLRDKLYKFNIEIKENTKVIDICFDHKITYVNSISGVQSVKGAAIIMAMGAKEKYEPNVMMPIKGITGVATIGEAHRMITIEGYFIGNDTIITGKDLYSAILARRIILEGGHVKSLIFRRKLSKEKDKDILSIVEDFKIPIIERAEITEIFGDVRVSKVEIRNIENNEIKEIECDSLILSGVFRGMSELAEKIGIKVNEKTKDIIVNDFKTSIPGFFACGNIIDSENMFKTNEENNFLCGEKASMYIKNSL